MSTVRRWPAACRILPLRRCGGCDFEALFSGSTYEENYRILVRKIREYDERIPP